MIKRIALALGLALVGVLGFALPAQAAVYGCPDSGWVCFYNYESFNTAGGIHGRDLRVGYGTCRVLPTSGAPGWTNGKVYNAASSILINNSGPNNLPGNMHLQFFDSNACDVANDYWFVVPFGSGDVNTSMWRLANSGWNDRIGSFRVIDAN